jgi:ribonuclease P/MRP protein subunit POP1
MRLSTATPAEEALIGRVISGGFSLSRGKGFALGCIPLIKLLHLKKQSISISSPLLVKLRDRDGRVCRLALLHY